ncbi:hypothetical protein FIBSPDRAFT_143167 [Athelia psychrophila]|uniref:Uncharacterized protein n=1 Tax=Athelia psychrophila TaxID=1759441 RepID=A0A166T1P3_9AGAM|nr:hypothetical protein FIBSPDRAFT_143167 [Fibularhizoctonia sp. CBS 109695]
MCSWDDIDFDEIVDLGTGAPRLLLLCLQTDNICIQRFVLPSSQITTCHLEVDDLTSFMEFLQEAVNLVDCSILVHTLDAIPRSPVRHTKMEKLSAQVFWQDNSDIFGSVLQYLDLLSIHDSQWTHRLPGYRAEERTDDPPSEWP